MQIKTPCCKLYLQQGAEKQIEQLSVSFIRTIPSAPESHRISGCINSRSRACGNAIYRRWGIAPRPETDFLALSIAQVLQIARGCAIIDKNKFGDWVVFPCCLVHSGGLGQHRTIPALRLKHRSGSCGTASALPKCSIMSGCGTRIVLRGQKPLALCDRCPCFGSLFPPLAALTFAASSIICAFDLAAAAPRAPYRHLELCGIAFVFFSIFIAKKAPPDEKSGGAFLAYQVINVRAFPQHVTPCFPLFHAQTSFSTPSRTAFQSTA